jgi:hypothetical protein
MLLLAIVVAIAIILIWAILLRDEGFSSKREKASRIHEWFTTNTSHSYSKYRSDLDRKSNIVEYEDVKRLFDEKNFTIGAVEAAI